MKFGDLEVGDVLLNTIKDATLRAYIFVGRTGEGKTQYYHFFVLAFENGSIAWNRTVSFSRENEAISHWLIKVPVR
jgi:hypothetical protein